MSREIDTRRIVDTSRSTARRLRFSARPAAAANPLAIAPAAAVVAPGFAPPAAGTSLVERALSFVRAEQTRAAGFAGQSDVSSFIPDPVPQRTSAGAAAVHLQQTYRGLPVFQMVRTVRFGPNGDPLDAQGQSTAIAPDISIAPKLTALEAGQKAAEHLATTGSGVTVKDEFGQTAAVPVLHVKGFVPRVLAAFPMLPTQPTVLEWVADEASPPQQGANDASEKPFENPVTLHLLLFEGPEGPRLAWYAIVTFKNYADQYAVIVSADAQPGQILYSRSMLHKARAQGAVYEFSPAVADRSIIPMPRPIEQYPVMPSSPLAGFPPDWVTKNQLFGNSTRATLNFTAKTLDGTPGSAPVEFQPADALGDDQKLLNIFYFCNYMHDFLYVLGFDEAAGNFQEVNFTHVGVGGDFVRARAHSGPVDGTANMSTAADGQPPVMNMGLVASTGRHTSFDSEVVFHEYTHGLTNRLVGGTRQGHMLEAPQSEGMGEGWSDFFALTIQNYFRALKGQLEKTVIGDWVVDNPAGIRTAPYDDNYPTKYGDIPTLPRNPESNLPDEHATGEVWCAALMMMTRGIRTRLGHDVDGYRLAWQMVVDGLKLTPANPSFLQARDAILVALKDLRDQHRIPPATYQVAFQAAWKAFANFGMGSDALSEDSGVDSITGGSALPVEA
jgi:extracellular elastinolytic metalloproteinase